VGEPAAQNKTIASKDTMWYLQSERSSKRTAMAAMNGADRIWQGNFEEQLAR
jgi:hypothetical protein